MPFHFVRLRFHSYLHYPSVSMFSKEKAAVKIIIRNLLSKIMYSSSLLFRIHTFLEKILHIVHISCFIYCILISLFRIFVLILYQKQLLFKYILI